MLSKTFCTAAAVACVAQAAQAGIISSTNIAIWNAQVAAGGMSVETETFNAISNGFYSSPFGGSTASVVWSASAAGGLYVQDGVFSTNNPTTLTFAFTPGVRAVAGNFFGTDINFGNATVLFTVQLSDGTGYSGLATSPADFTGFYSTTSATISGLALTVSNFGGSGDVYPSVDNLYFGVVPAPGAVALLCAAGLSGARRRRS